jgi:hypothetical protein
MSFERKIFGLKYRKWHDFMISLIRLGDLSAVHFKVVSKVHMTMVTRFCVDFTP